MRKFLIIASLLLSGCGTTFGYKMGDMSYVHKPRCENPAKERTEESYASIKPASRKRIGGLMAAPGSAVPTVGHWHYYC